MVIAAEPPVWVVAVGGAGLYEVRAAGPFASFRAADEFRGETVDGLSPEEAEKFAVVALESPHHVRAFASGLGERG